MRVSGGRLGRKTGVRGCGIAHISKRLISRVRPPLYAPLALNSGRIMVSAGRAPILNNNWITVARRFPKRQLPPPYPRHCAPTEIRVGGPRGSAETGTRTPVSRGRKYTRNAIRVSSSSRYKSPRKNEE